MEYPMATLVTGNRSLRSLVGVTVHEMAHSWFQALIATNESLYEFLDEGFTSYATSLCMDHLFADAMGAPHRYSYGGYINQAKSGNEEPLITHADHYMTNRAYGIAAYSKGEVLLAQLAGVMGAEQRDAGLKTYFAEWSFKHPGINDFKRVMEKASDLELDWYFQYFVNTTHTIDYAISGVQNDGEFISIEVARLGNMPMPIDVQVTFDDDTQANYHIPLVMMRGHRPLKSDEILGEDWAWVNPNYTLSIPAEGRKVKRVEIDPARHLADVDRDNNSAELCTTCVQSFKQ
jgi:aminopeptidase N